MLWLRAEEKKEKRRKEKGACSRNLKIWVLKKMT
jgi:hypothetical protein